MTVASAPTIRVPADELRRLARASFRAVGVPEADADAAGDVLWMGELMGISTHGTRRLITYIQRIHDGAIKADPDIRSDRTAPSLTVLARDDGPGPVVCRRGAAEAIPRARQTGTGHVQRPEER